MARDERDTWEITTDHEQIVAWADAHDAVPVHDPKSGGPTDLCLVTDPDDTSGDQLSWAEFFERFNAEELAFRYQERDSEDAACELISRQRSAGRHTADEKVSEPDRTAASQITASDTGEGEPTVFDEVENNRGADVDEESSMSESAHGAELPALTLDEIHEDPGVVADDSTAEYLVFKNTAEETLDLSSWSVQNAAGDTYVFPEGFTLVPGARVTLHSGHGEETQSDRYWGETGVWDDDGDVIVVRTADGRRVLREPYKE